MIGASRASVQSIGLPTISCVLSLMSPVVWQMHPAYLETRFRTAVPFDVQPVEFAIITAYATTGETWTPEENQAADQRLSTELQRRNVWFRRLTGFSPSTGHAEPGWAADMSWEDACEVGWQFRQDAVYFVRNDMLYVTHCQPMQRSLVPVAAFSERLDFLNADMCSERRAE